MWLFNVSKKDTMVIEVNIMGKLACIIGVISIVIAAIPYVGVMAIFPAFFGFVLGFLDVVNKRHMYDQSSRKYAIWGMVLSILSFAMVGVWILFAGQ